MVAFFVQKFAHVKKILYLCKGNANVKSISYEKDNIYFLGYFSREQRMGL